MISKYDIQKLQDLPIEQVSEALNLEVKKHKSLCPFHSDSRPSLTFNVHKNKYRCYVCDARGGSIDLVMHTQNWNFYESCMWLANQFGITISDERDYKPQTVKQPIREIREIQPVLSLSKYGQEEKPDIPYLTRLMAQPVLNDAAKKFLFDERKLSQNVIGHLGISSISYNCPMSSSPKPTYFDGPALLIPYRDIDGNLISVQSRYLGEKEINEKFVDIRGNSCSREIPRFRFPKGSHCTIFNLNILKDCKPHEPIFITEGVTDCLAMLSAGFKSIAIPSATLLSDRDKETLLSLSSRACGEHVEPLAFHMYPDADEPGEKLFEQLKALLPQLVRHSLPSGFKDVGQYYSYLHKGD